MVVVIPSAGRALKHTSNEECHLFKRNEECHLSRSTTYLETSIYTCYVDVHLDNLLYNVYICYCYMRLDNQPDISAYRTVVNLQPTTM